MQNNNTTTPASEAENCQELGIKTVNLMADTYMCLLSKINHVDKYASYVRINECIHEIRIFKICEICKNYEEITDEPSKKAYIKIRDNISHLRETK